MMMVKVTVMTITVLVVVVGKAEDKKKAASLVEVVEGETDSEGKGSEATVDFLELAVAKVPGPDSVGLSPAWCCLCSLARSWGCCSYCQGSIDDKDQWQTRIWARN
ncbi:hypothetical protein BCR41DRAFT_364412 [Lobosporangium transversale]|uniref:Secreted protein n=1 Tax=Lobosporangium transversale TaxID=64571 RepID=A0A1Y2G6L1_9FUNG|nr:hypothetical protein BCR41DRAFT_364412 [Lobosporangium transversale]ORY98330.1 hypothetical protein BCR41DRAFT_364412 [Lobosporangium transversale]|eukprot:XP_021875741.1 hypothetical protein BCR41DRAFT_364412 [Lobosporangium transversale]